MGLNNIRVGPRGALLGPQPPADITIRLTPWPIDGGYDSGMSAGRVRLGFSIAP